ncbi:amidohydrolase family protein [Streptomyces sp. MA5143a]|uniref:amidohydrolase family protein n=1 Tax=Streptomyces sp. MA5143a TaxID=2083010 RepID=UPI000D1A5402|nr:amidohydrolase family protein [Streptomyces sp. MA5143a]SPF02732.1 Atrazine chlorohydrolase [Streptomyces sp. MA5143a]
MDNTADVTDPAPTAGAPDTAPAASTVAGPADREARAASRRHVLAGALAVGAATGTGAFTASPAAAASRPPEAGALAFESGRPVLFRRATVVTMDPRRGVLPDTDVLVRGTDIEAVGKRLPAPPHATVIDAAGALLLPGFVDTHRHMWQSALRGVGADWTLGNYFAWIIQKWGYLFRPEDIYAANYLGMVEAVDDGVTTVTDWSHGLRTPDHADAAVDALSAVPGRARFAYGNAFAPNLGWVVDGRVDRMLKTRFSGRPDQLVTMQMALDIGGDTDDARQALKFARDRDLPVTTHAGLFGIVGDEQIKFIDETGSLSPSYTLVHASSLSDDAYRIIADSGAQLSVSAESELNAGQGYPSTAKARQYGIPVSLSMDTVVWWSGDMFSAMRATLNADRGLAHLRAHEAGKSVAYNALRAHDVLEYATLGGARVLGLDRLIGSITPGKRADLVMLRTDTPAMTLMSNPIGHIVFQSGRGDVDTVLVNGRVLKHRGTLIGADRDRARRLVDGSLQYLRSKIPDKDWEQAMNPPTGTTTR